MNLIALLFIVHSAKGYKAELPSAHHFDKNVGRAIHVLQHDIPNSLIKPPDMSIYTENIGLSDPHKIRLTGKNRYSQIYKIAQSINKWILRNMSHIQAGIIYNDINATLHSKINAAFFPMSILQPISVDIMSHYHFDSFGLIEKHIIDFIAFKGPDIPQVQFIKTIYNRRPPLLAFSTFPKSHTDIYGNIIPPDKVIQKSLSEKIKDFIHHSMCLIKKYKPQKCNNDTECPSNMNCCNWPIGKFCCHGPSVYDDNLHKALIPIPIPVENFTRTSILDS